MPLRVCRRISWMSPPKSGHKKSRSGIQPERLSATFYCAGIADQPVIGFAAGPLLLAFH